MVRIWHHCEKTLFATFILKSVEDHLREAVNSGLSGQAVLAVWLFVFILDKGLCPEEKPFCTECHHD